uniref:Uncharacterized protein n=1 Tax=Lepeophtheirus salmonis TaxID=72036 RepID=A0A0K2V558_LEPSM
MSSFLRDKAKCLTEGKENMLRVTQHLYNTHLFVQECLSKV